MLTLEQLDESCRRNGLTSLVCEQGFKATLQDVLDDYPDVTPTPAGDFGLFVSAMERMLEENLDYGRYSDSGEDDAVGEEHSFKLQNRWDIIEQVATAWVNGEFSGKDKPEKELAQEMATRLAAAGPDGEE